MDHCSGSRTGAGLTVSGLASLRLPALVPLVRAGAGEARLRRADASPARRALGGDGAGQAGAAPVMEQLEQVVHGADQAPLALHGVESSAQEAPVALVRLDGAEDRLNGLGPLPVGVGTLDG